MGEDQNDDDLEDEVDVNEAPEVLIVLRPDAIVQPLTVVIELLTAAIAGPAVLRPRLHVGVAYVAEQIEWLTRVGPEQRELFALDACFALSAHEDVCRHRYCADIGKVDRDD